MKTNKKFLAIISASLALLSFQRKEKRIIN